MVDKRRNASLLSIMGIIGLHFNAIIIMAGRKKRATSYQCPNLREMSV